MLDTYRKQFQTMPEHEGFTNFPTFTIWLEIKNNQGLWYTWQSIARGLLIQDSKEAKYRLEDMLRDDYQDPTDNLNLPGPYSTVLNYALEFVNWREIAEDLLETARESLELEGN